LNNKRYQTIDVMEAPVWPGLQSKAPVNVKQAPVRWGPTLQGLCEAPPLPKELERSPVRTEKALVPTRTAASLPSVPFGGTPTLDMQMPIEPKSVAPTPVPLFSRPRFDPEEDQWFDEGSMKERIHTTCAAEIMVHEDEPRMYSSSNSLSRWATLVGGLTLMMGTWATIAVLLFRSFS
jgi:hypothetical protein